LVTNAIIEQGRPMTTQQEINSSPSEKMQDTANERNPSSIPLSEFKAAQQMPTKKILPLVIFVCLFFLIIGSSWYIISHKTPLIIQGECDATEIKIASKVVGRIQTIPVHKGDQVTKGQLLVQLESQDLLAKLEQARAVMQLSKEEYNKLQNGFRNEDILVQSNLWIKAKSVLEQTGRTVKRWSSLQATDAISLQQLQDAERDLYVAQSTERAAKASFDQAVTGYRDEDKKVAAARCEQANQSVKELEALVMELKLSTPISGEVQDRIVEPGELVSAGFPVISIVDLKDIWVTFNLREDLLASIRMGSIINVRIPALGNREIPLKVNYISPRGDFAAWRATKATGDFDLKTFEIRAIPTGFIEGLRPGMTALATWKRTN